MKLLVLHRELPFPADNGGKLRAAHLVRYLARHHEVAFACFTHGEPRRLPPSLDFADFQQFSQPLMAPWWLRRFSALPSEVVDLRSSQMRDYVNLKVKQWSPDALITSDPALTQYLEPHGDRPRILDYLMVLTLTAKRERDLAHGLRRGIWQLRWQKHEAYHRRIAPLYDLCLVNSREDQADLQQSSAVWKRVEFLPNGLELDEYPVDLAPPQPNTLIYPGSMTYEPNRIAIEYFVKHILPRVKAEVPDVQLLITGAVPAGGKAPQAPELTYTGYVPDVRRVIAGAWACVVPLRSGAGGARFKLLEALALGTPLVSTSIGAEGLDFVDGQHLFIADEPEFFAKRIVQLLQSPSLRSAISRAGRELMEQEYNWERLGARICQSVEDLTSMYRGSRATLG